MPNKTRRRFLELGSVGLLVATAGCSSDRDAPATTENAATSEPDVTREELRARLREKEQRIGTLETELDAKEERIAELESELEAAGGPGFDESVLRTARDVALGIRESVVVSVADVGQGRSTGTAWFVDEGTLVSTGHGAGEVDEVTCWTVDGESFDAAVVDSVHGQFREYDHLDLSILETDFGGSPIPLGSSESLSTDQPLVQVGHPSGVGNWVHSLGRYRERDPFHGLLSTVPTLQGNSGSPVVTLDGEAVGITTGKTSSDDSYRKEGEAPEVASEEVRTSFADALRSVHDPAEAIREFMEQV